MSATAVNPDGVPQAAVPAPQSEFVQMTDEEVYYREEEALMEKKGRRLRRAALTAGIFQAISIVCVIYATITIRWVLIEWQQPEKTAYDIADNMGLFKLSIFCDTVITIVDTLVGTLVGMILMGAGVNPATAAIVIVFKLIQQAIMGANVIFLIGAVLLVDENLPLADTIKNYYYSDNQPPIGTQVAYFMLLLNKYGHIFGQVLAGVHYGILGFAIVMWGVFPRYLGITLFIAGPCLIANSFLFFYWPGYDGELTLLLMLPTGIASIWLCGWLLVNTPHPSKNRDLFSSNRLEAPKEGQQHEGQQHEGQKP
jgi:hypothetical protein